MLERVVTDERIGFRGKVERDVMNEVRPGIGDDVPGSRHEPFPLARAEQKRHIDKTVGHPKQYAEKVPMPGHANGVPIAWKPDPRRHLAGILLGGPDSICGSDPVHDALPIQFVTVGG